MRTFRVILLCILLYPSSFSLIEAQETDKRYYSTNRSTVVAIGSSNMYDTYLSPLKYKGTSLRIIDEQMKKTSWFHDRFTRLQLIDLEVNSTQNPAGNAREYSILGQFSWGGHYNLLRTDKFRFAAGGLWNVAGGVLYNQRNSNNPASAKAYSNIDLSIIGFYSWKNITFRGQISTPLLGVLFSPHYGQSYYEISLGNSVGVINFASFHNQRALRGYFTADIPISKIMLRVGYLSALRQTKVHDIISHNYSHNFVIGLVSESINLSGNKIKSNKIIDSSYY